MQAAARAAKKKGDLPPALWKRRLCAKPTWTELDNLSYRETVQAIVLENVYTVVEAWASGGAAKDPEIMRAYSQLVGMGIVGKNV